MAKLPIDFDGIAKTLLSREFTAISMAPDNVRSKESMERGTIVSEFGIRLIKMVQYSCFPHMARRDFYEQVAQRFKKAKTHTDCDEIQEMLFLDDWHQFRWGVYRPDDEIPRCYSLDGRGAGLTEGPPEKLPMEF